jgi:nitrate reductase gamma subunit
MTMPLLEFARGPAFRIAVLVFSAGLLWRIVHLLLAARKADLSEPRQGGALGGGLATIFTRLVHRPEFRERTRNGTLIAYTMHIGLAIVVFGSAQHVILIDSLAGISWTPLPAVVVHVASGITLAALFAALGRRLTHPVLRLLSNFDDYFSWFVTALPLVTGVLATAHVGLRYETLLALHILSFDVFLVWFPFGKLMHAIIVFGSRYTTGATFTRRGARA